MQDKIIKLALLLICNLCFGDFEEMMGKGTPLWEEVKTPEDHQNLAFYESLYNHAKEDRVVIPKTLHFIWLGKEKLSVKNIKGWVEKHEGWKVKVWSDRPIKGLPKGCKNILVDGFDFQHLGECFADTRNDVEKEELLRNEILFQEGGVFVDTDVVCLKRLADFPYSFYGCLAPPHDPVLSSSINVSSAIVASIPHHPILQEALQRIAASWNSMTRSFPGDDEESALYRVIYRTYFPFNEAIKAKATCHDIVFPALYFHAIAGRHALFAEHTYDCSWIKGNESFETCAARDLDVLSMKLHRLSLLNWLVLSFAFLLTVLSTSRKVFSALTDSS